MVIKPIVVDLDGTLIHSDMLHESAIRLLRDHPFEVFKIPFLLFKGKAFLKSYLGSRTEFDAQTLPYNLELIEWRTQQRAEGRKLTLCTASDKKIARLIASYLGIFDEVIASDGLLNVIGKNKASALVNRFGPQGYDYVGNSHQDLPVWSQANKAIVVSGSSELVKKVRNIVTVERVFPEKHIGFSSWSGVLRIHQWLKNLLLFVSLFAAHDLGNGDAWGF